MSDEPTNYEDMESEIIYKEGDKVRRLRGTVFDVEKHGFVKIVGMSRTFYINPDVIERIEHRNDVHDVGERASGEFLFNVPEMAAKRADFLIEQLGDSADELDRQTQIKQGMSLRQLIIMKESEKIIAKHNEKISRDGNQ